MSKLSRYSSFLRGALMLTAALSCAAMSAQTTDEATTTTPVKVTAALPASMASTAYSSSADQTAASPANVNMAMNMTPFNFLNAMQYGSGSRGGAPRYRGGNSNADGSSKWIFFGGAGISMPGGGTTSSTFTPNYSFQVGGGRQFSKKLALPIEFDYNRFGMSGTTLANQEQVYATMATQYNNAHPGCTATSTTNPCAYAPNPLDGNMHVWSFTVDPTETFSQSDTLGIYAVEGVGFYHKVSDFLTPQSGIYFDPYYGPIQYTANAVVDHYTSNAVGFNGGLGVTYKFSRFSSERFYAEVRYVFVDNSLRNGITIANMNSSANNYLVANDFPANSNHTSYLPINVGIRF